MAGENHADFQPCQSLHCLLGLHAIRHQDIGVVFLCLMHNLGKVHLVSKTLSSCQMLAKAVIGEQNLLLRAVSHHAVRPVQHRGSHKGQGALADGQGIPSLDSHIILLPIAAGQPLQPIRVAGDNLGVRALLGHKRNTAGMVRLHMIGHDIINLGRVHNIADAPQHLQAERSLHRINQRNLLIHNKISIICRTTLRAIAVEAAHGVIHRTNPVNILLNFYR